MKKNPSQKLCATRMKWSTLIGFLLFTAVGSTLLSTNQDGSSTPNPTGITEPSPLNGSQPSKIGQEQVTLSLSSPNAQNTSNTPLDPSIATNTTLLGVTTSLNTTVSNGTTSPVSLDILGQATPSQSANPTPLSSSSMGDTSEHSALQASALSNDTSSNIATGPSSATNTSGAPISTTVSRSQKRKSEKL